MTFIKCGNNTPNLNKLNQVQHKCQWKQKRFYSPLEHLRGGAVFPLQGKEFHNSGATTEKALLSSTTTPTSHKGSTYRKTPYEHLLRFQSFTHMPVSKLNQYNKSSPSLDLTSLCWLSPLIRRQERAFWHICDISGLVQGD